MSAETQTAKGQTDESRCWCCGQPRSEGTLVHLGNHPEVGIRISCVHFLRRRARDQQATVMRQTLRCRRVGPRASHGAGLASAAGDRACAAMAQPAPALVARRQELGVQLTVLAVQGCPNAPVVKDRLTAVLDGRAGVSVSHEVISDEGEAARWHMHGSPTLLIDGADPFAQPGQAPSMSCRLYPDADGKPSL